MTVRRPVACPCTVERKPPTRSACASYGFFVSSKFSFV